VTNLTDVYYGASQEQWNAISSVNDAAVPSGATIHYAYKRKYKLQL